MQDGREGEEKGGGGAAAKRLFSHWCYIALPASQDNRLPLAVNINILTRSERHAWT